MGGVPQLGDTPFRGVPQLGACPRGHAPVRGCAWVCVEAPTRGNYLTPKCPFGPEAGGKLPAPASGPNGHFGVRSLYVPPAAGPVRAQPKYEKCMEIDIFASGSYNDLTPKWPFGTFLRKVAGAHLRPSLDFRAEVIICAGRSVPFLYR